MNTATPHSWSRILPVSGFIFSSIVLPCALSSIERHRMQERDSSYRHRALAAALDNLGTTIGPSSIQDRCRGFGLITSHAGANAASTHSPAVSLHRAADADFALE